MVRKILSAFFYTLGVIFFLLICIGAYLWFADPFGVRPFVEALTGNAKDITTEVVGGIEDKATEDKHPLLNATQERALEVVGIDPAKVPTTISAEEEKCFIDKLGEDRVREIQAGATPGATEIFKARECVE